MQVKDIILFIMQYFYCMNFEGKNKKFIRNILKENQNFKKLQYKKGFVFKVDLKTLSFRIDNNSIKNNNFKIIEVQDLLLLKHNEYYKNNPSFKKVKNIKIVPFIRYDYDISFLYIICFSKKDYLTLKHCLLNINTWKYKGIFSKEERSIIAGMKYGFKKYYKYSWNLFYIEDIETEIENIKTEIKKLQKETKILNEIIESKINLLNDFTHYKKFNILSSQEQEAIKILEKDINSYIDEYEEILKNIDSLEEEAANKEAQYNNLKYGSGEPETTLKDYE